MEKGTATHCRILAWRIPQTVRSMGAQRVRHDEATFISLHPEVYKPRKNKSCTANVHKVPATPRAPPSDKHPYEQASSWLPRHRLTPRSPESLTSSGA